MTKSEPCHYRGYDILPAEWTVAEAAGRRGSGRYLSTRAKKEDALAEAKQVIYRIVLRAAEFISMASLQAPRPLLWLFDSQTRSCIEFRPAAEARDWAEPSARRTCR